MFIQNFKFEALSVRKILIKYSLKNIKFQQEWSTLRPSPEVIFDDRLLYRMPFCSESCEEYSSNLV